MFQNMPFVSIAVLKAMEDAPVWKGEREIYYEGVFAPLGIKEALFESSSTRLCFIKISKQCVVFQPEDFCPNIIRVLLPCFWNLLINNKLIFLLSQINDQLIGSF